MTGTDEAPAYAPEEDRSATVRHRYDWAERDPAMAVVETLAVALDREPAQMEPLYGVVDPDALNALVYSSHSSPSPSVQISFRYRDARVSVSNTGLVSVSRE